MKVSFVYVRGFLTHQAGLDLDTGRAQMRVTLAGNFWVEIFDGRYDAFDAGSNQRVSARRCAAVMGVRFERDVGRAAASFCARELKRDCLRVLDFFEYVEAFAGNLSCWTDDNTADKWSRTD